MVGWLDGWMDGWLVGWMDGWSVVDDKRRVAVPVVLVLCVCVCGCVVLRCIVLFGWFDVTMMATNVPSYVRSREQQQTVADRLA